MLTAKRETFQAELDALLATGCNDPAAGSNVTFLHSDHLGRPKFATNADGDVIWDEGITTPFGIQITAMAAQTQALMFPGQYQDLETTGAGVTLSHNWHRTYDPTLGRYLQSDPIGLAGGLNRYGYVGGNPLSFVDSTGLDISAIITDKGDGSTTGHAGLIFQDQFGNCFRYDQAAAPGGGIFRDIALLLGLPAPATVNVVPVPCDQLDNGVRVPLTPEQDHKVSQCVIKEMNAPKLYQLYGNNCAGSISSLMRCAGIPVNQPFSPKPDAIRKPFERLRP